MSQEPEDDDLLDEEGAAEPIPAPGPPVPWTVGDLAIGTFFIYLLWPQVVLIVLLGSGLFSASVPDGAYVQRVTTAEQHEKSQQTIGLGAGPAGGHLAEPAMFKALQLRLLLWAFALAA